MQMKYQQKSVSEYLLTAGTVFSVIGTETGYIVNHLSGLKSVINILIKNEFD
jgi:hypothetical protein